MVYVQKNMPDRTAYDTLGADYFCHNALLEQFDFGQNEKYKRDNHPFGVYFDFRTGCSTHEDSILSEEIKDELTKRRQQLMNEFPDIEDVINDIAKFTTIPYNKGIEAGKESIVYGQQVYDHFAKVVRDRTDNYKNGFNDGYKEAIDIANAIRNGQNSGDIDWYSVAGGK